MVPWQRNTSPRASGSSQRRRYGSASSSLSLWWAGLLSLTVALASAATASVAGEAESARQSSLASQTTPAPTIRIVAPADGQLVSGESRVVIETTSSQGIKLAILYRDGVLIGSDSSRPYEVRWDTRPDADGPHRLVAKAISADLPEVTSPTITVTVDNTPPTVAWVAPPHESAAVGIVRLEVEARDVLGIRIVRFLVNGQAVGDASSPPYHFTWDTMIIPNGRYMLEARAVDQAGNSVSSRAVTAIVTNINRPPIFSLIGSKTVEEGQGLSFKVDASDPDGERDPLTYRAFNLPSWASFDSLTREFSGVPDHGEASQVQPTTRYPDVRFEVCDPEPLCGREELTISVVNVNRSPVLEPPEDQGVNEGEALTAMLAASDPDGDLLTCTAEPLPAWATFDASTCTLAGTPDFEIVSPAESKVTHPSVGVEVCDPEPLCANGTMVITVVDVNRPPAWEPIGNKHGDEGRLVQFNVHAEDADGDTLVLAVPALPDGATFRDAGDGRGTLSWRPRFDQSGNYEVTFDAKDGSWSVSARVRITVRQRSLAISGVIRDQFGEPAEGAAVQFTRAGENVKQVKTDAQGFYLAKDLLAGTYTVRPSYDFETFSRGAFSAKEQTIKAATFTPRSQRVTITDQDHPSLDFRAKFP